MMVMGERARGGRAGEVPNPIKSQHTTNQGKQQQKQTQQQQAQRVEVRRLISGGHGTPAPRWKLYDNPFFQVQRSPFLLSARKLAATLWEQYRPPNGIRTREALCYAFQHSIDEAGNGGNNSNGAPAKSMPSTKKNHNGEVQVGGTASNGSLIENGSLVQTGLISADKSASMDDSITLDELFTAYNRIQILEGEHSASKLLVQSLRTELELAHARMRKVEIEQKTSRKEMEHLLKKIAEERTLWRSQEQEMISKAVKTVEKELETERKSKRKMEIINKKLSKQLAEAKMDLSKSMQELENERKARELVEGVCNELAKEIGEDKAKFEERRQESDKCRQELEEERRMLQMAEILREERVQMKLEAARLYLEEKHLALETLKSELEGFLETTRASKVDATVFYMRGEELLRDAASSVRIQDIKDLSYQSSAADGFCSGYENLQAVDLNNDAREVESTRVFLPNTTLHNCINSTLNLPTVNPSLKSISISPKPNYSKASVTEDGKNNEDKRKEEKSATGERSNGEEETNDSYQEIEEGKERVYDYCRENKQPSCNEADVIILQTETNEEVKEGPAVLITEEKRFAERDGELKKSPAMHLPVSNSGRGEFYKTSSVHDRLPNPAKYSSFSQQSVVHRAHIPFNCGLGDTPDTGNPHIARGIKGFIEWPKGIRQNSLKTKLESQKAQLRHVLNLKHQQAEISRS
ncbi:uncharacterized protein At5g41620 [Cryptomeria japonica]|uniref:uncharacterized protein At5g41620 n=1 Tax=Cryptomeria japonica TaxID=3369 RepID=UPI0025AC312A|nr:uncharacterized protein At5g41620 [Cryptomeria japonica]